MEPTPRGPRESVDKAEDQGLPAIFRLVDGHNRYVVTSDLSLWNGEVEYCRLTTRAGTDLVFVAILELPGEVHVEHAVVTGPTAAKTACVSSSIALRSVTAIWRTNCSLWRNPARCIGVSSGVFEQPIEVRLGRAAAALAGRFADSIPICDILFWIETVFNVETGCRTTKWV